MPLLALNKANSIPFFFKKIRFPPGWGDLDIEMGWREEGQDNGGDVVAAVVHAFAEPPQNLLEG